MNHAPAVSAAQVAAQLDVVLGRDAAASAVAIRAPGPLEGPAVLHRRGRSFEVRWCESRLALREALAELETERLDGGGLVLLTPLSDAEVPDDVAARLARARIFQPKGWEIVRQMFDAQGTDARLGRHDWMPQVLIDAAGAEPFAPVASGFLDLETAWREVLRRCLHLAEARPDAATLMRWAQRPDLLVLLDSLPARARRDAFEWLAAHAGPAGTLTLRAVEAGRAMDAAALGVVCMVVFAPAAEGATEVAKAAVRLERHVGDHHVAVNDGREWAQHATRLLENTPPDEARPVLERADALLRELGIAGFAHLSDWLPAGLEQRLVRLGAALEAQLAQASEPGAAAVEDAANAVLRHRLVSQQPLRADRVRMACRLVRWLNRAAAPAGSGLEPHVAQHADDGAFADWARFRLLGGDELPELSQAYGLLRAAVAQRKDAMNKAFAAALAAQVREAQPLGPRVIPLEGVLQGVLGPLAAAHPVLLLVVDGLSVSIFRELFERPERHGWTEWIPQTADRPLVGLAALPTITEVSRASLLCGRICVGTSANEKPAFAAQTALLASSSASHPPRLFHKGDLSDDGNLAAEVRAALTNPSQRVVGLVYNAVDDHLSGPDQLHQRWSLEELRLLLPVLREARDSRRVVVVTADHGHVLEDGSVTVDGGKSDRWREGTASADPRELMLSGSRVRTPDGDERVICLWSEGARYTGRKNGYHGGASAAEVVVPLTVLAPFGVNLQGWKPAPPQQPDWWDLPGAVASSAAPQPVPKTPARRPVAPHPDQGGLFGSEELPVPAEAPPPSDADWVRALLTSSVYAAQRQLAARVALPDEQMRALLTALADRGGKLGRAALARRLGVPELRLGGLLSAARRILNVDQTLVLTVDESAGMVEINLKLLQQQFRLAASSAERR